MGRGVPLAVLAHVDCGNCLAFQTGSAAYATVGFGQRLPQCIRQLTGFEAFKTMRLAHLETVKKASQLEQQPSQVYQQVFHQFDHTSKWPFLR